MSIGYSTVIKLRRIEAECAKMGLRIGYSKHGSYREYGDVMAVMPTNDALPIYSRDAELFCGTLDELSKWLQGAAWMHEYYSMLKLIDDKKVQKKENGIRHDHLVQKLKNEEVTLKG